MHRHPWERFLNALSYEYPTYEAANTYLGAFCNSPLVPEELYKAFYIQRTGTDADKELPKKLNFSSFFTKYSDGARSLFFNEGHREWLYIYLLLGLSDLQCAKEMGNQVLGKVTQEDIEMFRHYFWCVDGMSRAELQTFAATFSADMKKVAERFFTEDEAILRHDLKLPVNISDIDMLRKVKDTFYVEILKGMKSPTGMRRATDLIEHLTEIMISIKEVEKYSLSEQDMKPLFFPSFEEATEFISVEDMVKKGQDIVGGEPRPNPEEPSGPGA